MSFQQYNLFAGLTPVRVVSTSNVSGTYLNGSGNNGVGATLTVAASSLTIDSVAVAEGDRVLLHTQTNTNEQGIYVVTSIGSTVVLTRSDDMQSNEQLKAGQFVSVGAGSVNAGNMYSVVEPLPARLGVDAFVWNADPSAGGVTFSGGASTANALPVFSDTAGNIKAATTTVTLGQALSVTGAFTASGAIASTAGNVTSGSSGDAGTFISFPTTAANGTLIVQAVDAGDTSAHVYAAVYAEDFPAGGAAMRGAFAAGIGYDFLLNSGSGDIRFEGYSANIYSDTGDLHLAYDGSAASGNVGVGKVPTTRLDVDGTTSSTAINCGTFNNPLAEPVLTFTSGLTPVNYFQMTNTATANKPILAVVGTDTNIGMIIASKGTGQLQMVTAALTSPVQWISGTASQHTANFAFANAATTQTITFQDGDGTVAFTHAGGMLWTTVAGTSQAAAVDSGYVCGNAGQTTVTLPTTAAVGAVVQVEGLGAAGWVLTAGAGQTIKIGSDTTTVAGSLTSVAASDNVRVTCIVQNLTWRVLTTNSAGLTIS